MNKRNQLKAKKDKQGKVLILAISAGLLVMASLGAVLSPEKYNPLTLCELSPRTKHVFLFDLSDKLRLDTWSHIKKELGEAIDKIPEGDELEFYSLNSKNVELAIPIGIKKGMSSICKPKKAYTNELLSEMFDDHRHRLRIFKESLDSVISENFKNEKAGSQISPIYSQIKNILLFNQNKIPAVYVFSDFMEYTDSINVYACKGLDYKLQLPKMDLVSIYKIPTREKHQKCRDSFISNLFDENMRSNTLRIIQLMGENDHSLAFHNKAINESFN